MQEQPVPQASLEHEVGSPQLAVLRTASQRSLVLDQNGATRNLRQRHTYLLSTWSTHIFNTGAPHQQARMQTLGRSSFPQHDGNPHQWASLQTLGRDSRHFVAAAGATSATRMRLCLQWKARLCTSRWIHDPVGARLPTHHAALHPWSQPLQRALLPTAHCPQRNCSRHRRHCLAVWQQGLAPKVCSHTRSSSYSPRNTTRRS